MTRKVNPDFFLDDAVVEQFRRKGFVKIKQLFSVDFLADLKKKIHGELEDAIDLYATEFTGLKFDICEDEVLELISERQFRDVMSTLASRKLFFTQGIGFFMKKVKDAGLPWHIGIQSFGFQRAEDFGCSLWIPLDPIDAANQAGGMAYVPREKLNGMFMYDSVDPAMTLCLREMANAGVELQMNDFLDLRDGPLNNPQMQRFLEFYKESEDYEVGDAMLFDKYVIHRSEPLQEGPLDSRTAFVIRLIDSETRYDMQRAEEQEFFKDYFKVSGSTNFNREVCRTDNALIVESAYFKAPSARLLA